VFAVNTLAPYILTGLIRKAKRLVYLNSGMHRSGDPILEDLTWSARAWSGSSANADSKLHDAIPAFAVARKWPDVLSNALEPGLVATKMGRGFPAYYFPPSIGSTGSPGFLLLLPSADSMPVGHPVAGSESSGVQEQEVKCRLFGGACGHGQERRRHAVRPLFRPTA